MSLLSAAVGLVVGLVLLPTVSDLVSLLWIGLGGHRSKRPIAIGKPRLLFIVPAHDEEQLIESCLRSLLSMRYARTHFDIVVVADNCNPPAVSS